jgi:hypothetical protein
MRSFERPRRSRANLARWSALLGVALLALATPAAAATWTAVSSPNLTQFSNVLWAPTRSRPAVPGRWAGPRPALCPSTGR